MPTKQRVVQLANSLSPMAASLRALGQSSFEPVQGLQQISVMSRELSSSNDEG